MLEYRNNDIREVQREKRKVFRREQKDKFLNVIRNTATDENSVTITVEKMKELSEDLLKLRFKESHSEARLNVLSQLRKGACLGDEYIKPCLSGPTLQSIIHSLTLLKDPQCQLEAAACLTNFAGSSHQITEKVASKAGSFLIEFISCSNPQLQIQCIWAVTNICNDSEVCFLILKKHGLIPTLLIQLESSYPEIVESVICALVACTQYGDRHFEVLNIMKMAQVLLRILNQNSVNRQSCGYALHTIFNIYHQIMDSDPDNLGKLTFNMALQYLKNTMSEEMDMQIATACIRCLGVATACCDEFCATLSTDNSFGICVLKLLKYQYSHLKKELLWVLINIFASVDIGVPGFFLDLKDLIQCVKPFISPLDDKVLIAMYLLCTLLSRNVKYRLLMIHYIYRFKF